MNHCHTYSTLYQIVITGKIKRNSAKCFVANSSFVAKHDCFKNSFFPSAITEWNKLDCHIRSADSIKIFKKYILSFIKPMPNCIYIIHNPLGVKYLTRLRIGFSHLKEHKFKYNFQDSIGSMCSCISGIETTINFFLHCASISIKDKPSLTK